MEPLIGPSRHEDQPRHNVPGVIKLVFCVRRRSDVDAEEFHRYWRDDHGPLVTARAETLGIRRYVQVHRIDSALNDVLAGSRDAPEPYDGVAELWFDDENALALAASSDAGLEAGRELLEDERRFIDHARSPIFLAEEFAVIERA
jgi:uncharacterized protein (TIGR02118 family)